MYIVNLKKFDIFYFKGTDNGRFVYLGNGMMTSEYQRGALTDIEFVSEDEKNQEVVKVGKMIVVNLMDVGIYPVP